MKKRTFPRLLFLLLLMLTAWLLTLALAATLLPGMGMTALAAEDGDGGNNPPAPQETPSPTVPVLHATKRAGAEPDNTYGMVVLNFPKVNNESRAIKLYSGNYITACDPDANV